MTPETLSQLKSLLEKATPGRWESIPAGPIEYSIKGDDGWNRMKEVPMSDHDCGLIFALHNNAPDLIKAVEQRDRYRAALEHFKRFVRLYDQHGSPPGKHFDPVLSARCDPSNDTQISLFGVSLIKIVDIF